MQHVKINQPGTPRQKEKCLLQTHRDRWVLVGLCPTAAAPTEGGLK